MGMGFMVGFWMGLLVFIRDDDGENADHVRVVRKKGKSNDNCECLLTVFIPTLRKSAKDGAPVLLWLVRETRAMGVR
jgi:hypothetical protein